MSSQLPISTPSSTRVINTVPVQYLPFEIPAGPPEEWTPDAVIEHVKIGMFVELSTIPIYLYSMFSIQPDDGKVGTQTRAAIRGIVEQEMLHLSLSGNLLSALDGSIELYNYDFIPQYPRTVLLGKIPMNLASANKENLEYFLQIEAPDTPRPKSNNNERGPLPAKLSSLAPIRTTKDDPTQAYRSIGDLYEALAEGLKRLAPSDFAHNPDKQFSGLDFFDNQMVVITDLASALRALTTIIEQGKGNVAVPNSHYSVFVLLYLSREAWTLRKVPKNPKTKDYIGRSDQDFVYKLSLVFDAGFCYLLQTIQRVWKTGREPDEILLRLLLLRNVHAIMTRILTPVADILVVQKLKNPDNGLVGAPCFNYYPLNDKGTPKDPLKPEVLHKALIAEVAKARDASPTDDLKKSLEEMQDYIEKKIPSK